MKEFILLIRLPLDYGAEQASAVRAQWTDLTDQWKIEGIFVTSFIFPGAPSVISGSGIVVDKAVIENNRRIISCVVINAPNQNAAAALAKKCPVLTQDGIIEVREVMPRP